MTSRSLAPAAPHVAAAAITAALFVGGCLNGLLARAIESWKDKGHAAAFSLFGVSPFEIIVIVVAARLLIRVDARSLPPATLALAAPFAALVLWPSSTLSWIAVILFGTAVALLGTREVRASALLFAGLGLCAIWSSAGEALFSSYLLPLDARAVSHLLSLLRPDAIQLGNIVGNGSHRIVVLAGCSSLHAVPLAVLGWAALRLTCGRTLTIADGAWAAGLAIGLIALNIARLAAMAWSAPLYDAIHGDLGSMLFDGLVTAAIAAAALREPRRA